MKKGFTLIEAVIYVGILGVTTALVVSSIVQLSSVFGKARSERRVSSVAETALERIVREIKLACSIGAGFSSTNLPLNTFQDFNPPAGTTCASPPTTRTIASSGGALTIGGATLTPNVTVTNSDIFTQLTAGTISQGVRIKLTLTSGAGKYQATRTYYATATLRGSYP